MASRDATKAPLARCGRIITAGTACTMWQNTERLKADSHIACRAHPVPLPYRAAKGLECVFSIWFTQCSSVWFTRAMPCSDHSVLLKATAQHGRLSTAVLSRGLEKNGMVGAWHGHGMASVNQTRPRCVNQMGRTHSKPLAARHGRGTAWERRSYVNLP